MHGDKLQKVDECKRHLAGGGGLKPQQQFSSLFQQHSFHSSSSTWKREILHTLSNTQKGSKIKNAGSNIGIKWCRDRWWEKWIKNGWTVAGKWCIFSKITFISLHCCSDSLSTANITTYTMENTSQSRWHRMVPRLGHISLCLFNINNLLRTFWHRPQVMLDSLVYKPTHNTLPIYIQYIRRVEYIFPYRGKRLHWFISFTKILNT